MRREIVERWTVHGKINFVTVSASRFADFYNDALLPDDPTKPYQLLQGYPTRSADVGAAAAAAGYSPWWTPSDLTQNFLAEVFGLGIALGLAILLLEGHVLTERTRRRRIVTRMVESTLAVPVHLQDVDMGVRRSRRAPIGRAGTSQSHSASI